MPGNNERAGCSQCLKETLQGRVQGHAITDGNTTPSQNSDCDTNYDKAKHIGSPVVSVGETDHAPSMTRTRKVWAHVQEESKTASHCNKSGRPSSF